MEPTVNTECVKLLHAFIVHFPQHFLHSTMVFIHFVVLFHTVRIMNPLQKTFITQSKLGIWIIQIHAPWMSYQNVFSVKLYKVWKLKVSHLSGTVAKVKMVEE